ncbi:hypothetical protein D3C85_1397410 [compost metagenome]
MGIRAMIPSERTGSSNARRDRLVRIQPGATALARTPSVAQATAMQRVNSLMAALLDAYAGVLAEPKMPHIEAKFTTAPRAAFRPGRAALVMRNTAVRLTSMTRLKPSSSHSRL